MTTSLLASILSPPRLAALRASGMLDAPNEEAFDRLTRLVITILGVPSALVTLVDADRQFLVSCPGAHPDVAAARETPLSHSYCKFVVGSGEPMIVDDARLDERLRDNPAIEEYGAIAYAGIPLKTSTGEILGSFCALDSKPRKWTAHDIEVLTDLAASAVTELELRAATRTLQERDVRQVALLDQTSEMICAAGLDGIITYVNRTWEEKLGYSSEEARTLRPVDLVAPEHRGLFVDVARRLQQGEPVVDFEAVLVARNGRRLVCRGHGTPHFESGVLVGTYAVYRDVTEERQSEHVRARLVSTLEASPDFVSIVTSDRKLVFLNRAGRRLVGLSEDIDPSWVDLPSLRPPESFQHMMDVVVPAAVRDGIWQGESALMGGDGTVIPVSQVVIAHPSTRTDEPPYFLSVVAHDLRGQVAQEERRKAAELVREQDRAFQSAVLEHLAEGVVACDAEGRITLFNRTTREFHGLPEADVPAEDVARYYSLFHADGVTPLRPDEIPLFRALAGEVVVDQEIVIAPTGQARRTVIASGQQFHDASGQLLGAVIAMRDVTEQKRTERALVEAKEEAERANRAKSEFLSRASHELRTPLNSVIGFSGILLKNRSGSLAEGDMPYLQRIRANGAHLLSLVNDLLDIAKVEAGRMTIEQTNVLPFDLVHEAVASVEGRSLEKGIALVADVPMTLRPFTTDAGKLKQVLINLIGNAIKFTDEGTVTVRAIGDRLDRVASFVVEDTGCGIPQSQLRRIFEPFAQADGGKQMAEPGTGLGLAISKSFCDLLGYRLSVESELGRGTRFTIEL